MSANTSKSSKPSSGANRPLRTISVLLLAIIAFGAVAFIQGATKIKLGLDLRGGTSVTQLHVRVRVGK